MDVLFFTDSPEVRKILSQNRLPPRGLDELKPTLARLEEPALVYVDAGSWPGAPESLVEAAVKAKAVFVGLIDSSGKIKNPVPLMHKGLVDYIGQKEMPGELTRAHCNKVIAYIKKYRSDFQAQPANHSLKSASGVEHVSVPHGWKDVKTGRRYTFSIMFIELDEREEMEKRYGSKNLHTALQVFRKYIEKNVNAFGGKIWIWSHYGGVILFPFDAYEYNAVICGFRIVMYKFLHDAEESHFPNFISFRLALHIGDLVYQEKSKGEVVSDSLNTVFHLGQEYAEPGHFYLTGDIFQYAPEAIKPYFKELGAFEGRLVYRMRLPVL